MARRPYRVLRPAHKCQTPVEALQLIEDLERIEMAMHCLKKINPESIDTVDRERARKCHWTLMQELKSWHGHAMKRLKTEFLGVGDKPRD